MKNIKKIFILSITLSLLLTGCESIQKRIDKAEKNVNDAERVNANKYASKEIKTAAMHLQKAKVHKASGLKDQAKKSALLAHKIANKAYFKSLNEFVKSQNNLTTERKKSAKKSNADKLAPKKYSKAEKLSKQVKDDLKQLQHLQKKLKQLEAKDKS